MKKLWLVSLVLCLVVSLTACTTGAPDEGELIITKSQAIAAAQSSNEVHQQIAKQFGLKFFCSPSWGDALVMYVDDNAWVVALSGTISDDSNFSYDRFVAAVRVKRNGVVEYVKVNTDY